MNIKNIDFYYFSGTGNTFLVVKKMKETFVNKGITVNLFPIEKSNPSSVNPDHVIGLAFPVAVQGTYPFVWDFIKSLPESEGTGIFMVDTLQIFSGGVVGNIKKILKKKGYRPLAAKEIKMPRNFFPENIDEEENKETINIGLEQAELYAKEIINNAGTWKRIPVVSDIVSYLSKKEFFWKFMRKVSHFKIDKEKCIKCDLCVNLCPVCNIEMDEYPEFLGKCTFCMRCISFCPERAMFLPDKDYERYRAVEAEELLKNKK